MTTKCLQWYNEIPAKIILLLHVLEKETQRRAADVTDIEITKMMKGLTAGVIGWMFWLFWKGIEGNIIPTKAFIVHPV